MKEDVCHNGQGYERRYSHMHSTPSPSMGEGWGEGLGKGMGKGRKEYTFYSLPLDGGGLGWG